jgi:ribonucleoside-triphosphate reductase
MNSTQKALSDIVVFNKYARYREDAQRRETWAEIVDRYVEMMIKKYCSREEYLYYKNSNTKVDIEQPKKDSFLWEILNNAQHLYNREVLMSMRMAQFAGQAVEKNETRGYNCFSRDTRFITSEGTKSFLDFEDGDEINVLTPNGLWKRAVVRSYGRQKLNKLTLSRGRCQKQFLVTKDHRWLLHDGETCSLQKGDILRKPLDIFNDFVFEDATHWVVSEIETDVDEQVVWCLEVEDEHAFVLSGGIPTGNCSYLPIDHYKAFGEIMFLLLGGTGVGFSVQKHHVESLPEIRKPLKEQKFLVGDSIEGWAESINQLFKAYFGLRTTKPRFDYSDIRAKGERLVTAGGKAPGPEPLRICHVKLEAILNNKETGEKLTSLEVHDLVCHIADAVLAGGIRRAALISLFSFDDKEMATCKHGSWWELNPQRGRANNSAVVLRNVVKEEEFKNFWQLIKDSNSGEPGIYFSEDKDLGTNPCCEISLRPMTFCNLTEINAGTLSSTDDFYQRCKAASFWGTLQAGFTDFHFLRPGWQRTTEKEALVGVGITGIANGNILKLREDNEDLLVEGSNIVKQENERVAQKIGINSAARTTCIKPSGTTSLVVGTSSGIHAWYSKYYIRNMQTAVGSDLYNYFVHNHPELIKIMDYDPNTAVIGIPIVAPADAVLRENETALDLLERVKMFNLEWVKNGHNSGLNTNNVSATISIKDDEWGEVGQWMWDNKNFYNGLSVLPYDGGTYKDAPFMECTEEEFYEKLQYVHDIDLSKISEALDNTNLSGEIACGPAGCEIV